MSSDGEDKVVDSNWILEKLGFSDQKQRLRLGTTLVGRHSSADLKINSNLVSRWHAEITVSTDKEKPVQIKDLNSINGTYINNVAYRSETNILAHNDIIGFGADYDKDEIASLPLYSLRFEPLPRKNPQIVDTIEIDDSDENEDVKPDIEVPISSINRKNILAADNVLSIFGNVDEAIAEGLKKINPAVLEAVQKVTNAETIELLSDEEINLSQKLIPTTTTTAESAERDRHGINAGQRLTNHRNVELSSTPNATTATTTTSGELHRNMVTLRLSQSPNCFENSNETDTDNGNTSDPQQREEEPNEDLLYSQVLLDDMKTEMEDDDNDSSYKIEEIFKLNIPYVSIEHEKEQNEKEATTTTIISLIDSDNNSSDDIEEFDADLKKKVTNWTKLLMSSQVFPKRPLSPAFSPNEDEQHDDDNDCNNQISTTMPTEDENNIWQRLFKPIDSTTSGETTPQLLTPIESESSNSAILEKYAKNTKTFSKEEEQKQQKKKVAEKCKPTCSSSSLLSHNKKRKISRIESSSDDEEPDKEVQQINATKSAQTSIEILKYAKADKSIKQNGPPQIISPPRMDKRRRFKTETTIIKQKKLSPIKRKHNKRKHTENREKRRERLKDLSTKSEKTIDEITNKHKQQQNEQEKNKKTQAAIIKNTIVNRGAFLCEMEINKPAPPASKRESKKLINCNKSKKTTETTSSSSMSTTAAIPELKAETKFDSVDLPTQHFINIKTPLPILPAAEAHAQCVRKVNIIIREHAEKARARSAPKKLRFADVEKSFEEQERLNQKRLLIGSSTKNNLQTTTSNSTNSTDKANILSDIPISLPLIPRTTTPLTTTTTVCTSSTSENSKNLKTSKVKRRNSTITTDSFEETSTSTTLVTSAVNPITNETVNHQSSEMQSTNKKKTKSKKTVRFNDNIVTHYFESAYHDLPKVDRKDIMPHFPYRHRRTMIRQNFPIADRTEDIIMLILAYSNEFILQTNHKPIEKLTPMPKTFQSFENYQKIVFSLMKLEFLATLERDMKINSKRFKLLYAELKNVIDQNHYVVLEAWVQGSGFHRFSQTKCDLVLLEIGDKKMKVFAYMISSGMAPDDKVSLSKVFLEILPKSIEDSYLRSSKKLSIQAAIDNLQVTIGAYNAIFQLERTPLSEMILSPEVMLRPINKTPDRIVNIEIPKETMLNNNEVNNDQNNAILQIFKRICLNKTETTPNISLIQGPPGTGKSVVVVHLSLQIIYSMREKFRDKKILICAQSNCAVDAVASKLLLARWAIKDRTRRFKLVRFGIFEKMDQKVHPISLKFMLDYERVRKLNTNLKTNFENVDKFKNHLRALEKEVNVFQQQILEHSDPNSNLVVGKLQAKRFEIEMLKTSFNKALNSMEEREACQRYLSDVNIVCTTLSSCVKLSQYIDYFDVCIIDEATQCTEPFTLLPLRFGISSLVLVGDSQQLPATVISNRATEYGLSQSLFTRIERCIKNEISNVQNANEKDIIYLLRTQYRMHPEICKFPNEFFYNNSLLNAHNTLQHITPLVPYSVLNLKYAQNPNLSQGKISNNMEADFVVELLKSLNEILPALINSYGVITPYAQHRKTLADAVSAARLPPITVQTIDSYQGLEKDVIIISNARTEGVGFLAHSQRLNVAITRPKKCLILCGNFKSLQSVPAWRCLLNDAKQRSIYHEISAIDISDIRNRVVECLLIRK